MAWVSQALATDGSDATSVATAAATSASAPRGVTTLRTGMRRPAAGRMGVMMDLFHARAAGRREAGTGLLAPWLDPDRAPAIPSG